MATEEKPKVLKYFVRLKPSRTFSMDQYLSPNDITTVKTREEYCGERKSPHVPNTTREAAYALLPRKISFTSNKCR